MIPPSLKNLMAMAVKNIEISDRPNEYDLELLEQLYYWKQMDVASATPTDLHPGLPIQKVREQLVLSLTRQILKSDLFKSKPALRRFLDGT